MAEDYKNDEVLKKYILDNFKYVEISGDFYRKPRAKTCELFNPKMLGKKRNRSVRWLLMVKGVNIPAENIAFLLMNGRWPNGKIGFRPGKKTNVAWRNLITEGL